MLTYGEILDRAAHLASVLADAGVGPGRSRRLLPLELSRLGGCLACGLAQRRGRRCGRHAPPGSGGLGALPTGRGRMSSVAVEGARRARARADSVIRVDEAGQVIDSAPTASPDLETLASSDPGSLAVVIFTSGTTGQPKGITHTHGDLVAAARRVAAGICPQQRLPARSRAGPPPSRRSVQPVRAHGWLQPTCVSDVDRAAHRDRAALHRAGGQGPRSPGSQWTRSS